MLNKYAVTNFLERKLTDYDYLKELDDGKLDHYLNSLNPKPDFGSVKLRRHQKASFLLLNHLKRFLLYLDMGAGKTVISLMLLKYRKQRGDIKSALVFVPYITSVGTWIDEIQKHAPDIKCSPLLGTSKENLDKLSEPADIYIVCYQSAVAMFTDKVQKKGWVVNEQLLREKTKHIQMLVCDEVHKCKSHDSLTFQMSRIIASRVEWVVGLTGTPFGKDLMDLWPQFYLVDFGETLGRTISFYRAVFFNQKKNYWGGYEYTFKKNLTGVLHKTLKNRSIRYKVNEFADMPPKELVARFVDPPEDVSGYVRATMAELNKALPMGRKRYDEIESHYLKLRQLSSGFMTLKGEDEEKVHIQFEQNPKLDQLLELVDSLRGQKVVVFHHFIHSGQVISDALNKLKIKHARVWGGQKDKLGELDRFKNEPDCDVLVINTKSGSSSLNLQFASYMIFYEPPDSPIDRQQAEARIYRSGQTHNVIIYDLVCRGTFDMPIIQSCQGGKRLLDELLKDSVK